MSNTLNSWIGVLLFLGSALGAHVCANPNKHSPFVYYWGGVLVLVLVLLVIALRTSGRRGSGPSQGMGCNCNGGCSRCKNKSGD